MELMLFRPGFPNVSRIFSHSFFSRTNLHNLGLAGTNIAWPVLISVLQKEELNITSLDVSANAIYDKVFCILNPFISSGVIFNLSIGNMKGDLVMVEGICGSLLLNTSMKETRLTIDDTIMDCMDCYVL